MFILTFEEDVDRDNIEKLHFQGKVDGWKNEVVGFLGSSSSMASENVCHFDSDLEKVLSFIWEIARINLGA